MASRSVSAPLEQRLGPLDDRARVKPGLRLELLPRALQAAPPDARVAALAAGWEQDRLRIEAEATELAVRRARAAAAREAALQADIDRVRTDPP